MKNRLGFRIVHIVLIAALVFSLLPPSTAVGCDCDVVNENSCQFVSGCVGEEGYCTGGMYNGQFTCACSCQGPPPPPGENGDIGYPAYNDIDTPDSTYYYNWFGSLPSTPVSVKAVTKMDNAKSTEVITFFDGLGREIQTQALMPNGRALITNVMYDEAGNKKRESQPYEQSGFGTYQTPVWNNNDGIHYYTEYTYDALGRVKRVTNPDGTYKIFSYGANTQTASDELSHSVITTQDAYGKPKDIQNPLNDHVTYSYLDPLGLRTDVTNPAQQVTKSQSDSFGNARIIQHVDFGVRRNIEYDTRGNLVRAADGCSANWAGQNDFGGASYPCSRIVTNSYDALNRLGAVDYGNNGVDMLYFYDGYAGTGCQAAPAGLTYSIGRLTAAKSFYYADYRACYYYDVRGRIGQETRFIDGRQYDLRFSYDNAGNLLSLAYPGGADTAGYEYDRLGRMTNVLLNSNIIASYEYYPSGLLKTKTYPSDCGA